MKISVAVKKAMANVDVIKLKEFAPLADIDVATLGALTRGYGNPTMDTMMKIAHAGNMSFAELVAGGETHEQTT